MAWSTVAEILDLGAAGDPAIVVPDGPTISYAGLRALCAEAQLALNKAVDFRGLEYQAYTNPNPDVHLRLAKLYQRNHLYDSALYAVTRGLKTSPRDPRLLALRAQLLSHPPALVSSH